jgi:hypothetical protein
VFELSNSVFERMLGGAMHRIGTTDKQAGWEEVRRWMGRLDRAREHGLYVTEKNAGMKLEEVAIRVIEAAEAMVSNSCWWARWLPGPTEFPAPQGMWMSS